MNESVFNQVVGKNIRKYRYLYKATKGKMTQRDLAKKAGVSLSTIRVLENKNVIHGVSIYYLYKISRALEVKIDDLVKP